MGKKVTAKEVYLGRGLHSETWKQSFGETGLLYKLLKLVREDEDLVLEIRDDYINIYYKGGNMAKIASENSIQFDANYFKGYKRPNYEADNKEKARKSLKKEWLEKLKEDRDYKKFIKEMKKLMNGYWNWLREERGKELKEKDIQHTLCICNTEASEYTVIDVEFQVSTRKENRYTYVKPAKPKGRFVAPNKKAPRFDVIAVRNSDHRLCVIELKSGVNALFQKSGIGDHADSFEGSIGRNPKAFLHEMKGVIEDKKHLNLLNSDFYVSDAIPEFIYAYSFKENDVNRDGISFSKEQQKALFLKEIKRNQCEEYKVIFLEEGCYTLSDN